MQHLVIELKVIYHLSIALIRKEKYETKLVKQNDEKYNGHVIRICIKNIFNRK